MATSSNETRWVPSPISSSASNTTSPTTQTSPSRSTKQYKIVDNELLKYFTNEIYATAKIPSTDDHEELSRRYIFAEYTTDWRLKRAFELIRQDLENKFN
jgi:hypothetical protein